MTIIALILVAIVCIPLALRYGFFTAVTSVMLISILMFPRFITSVPDSIHVGVGPPVAAISTASAAAAICAAASLLSGKAIRGAFLLGTLLLLFLGLGFVFIWDQNDLVRSGVLVYASAAIAFMSAGGLAHELRSSERSQNLFVRTLFSASAVQFVVSLLQLSGISLFAFGTGTADLAGRASGTLGHPGNLGKVVFIAGMLALLFIRSPRRSLRRLCLSSVVMSVIVLGVSEGRANFVALIAALILWALLLPRATPLTSKVVLPGIVLLGGLVFFGTFIDRFMADPEGGDRGRLMEAAIPALAENFESGVGPNSYVAVVGQTDALTASGWPVHNAIMLAAIELGVIGAALLFLPVVYVGISSLRAVRRVGIDGDAARIFLATVPGLVIILSTGWGMIANERMILLYWFAGFCITLVKTGQAAKDDAEVIGVST